MTFEEAMRAMREGKKVRRPIWKSAYIFLNAEGTICCGDTMPSSTRVYPVKNVATGNITSTDWEVIDN